MFCGGGQLEDVEDGQLEQVNVWPKASVSHSSSVVIDAVVAIASARSEVEVVRQCQLSRLNAGEQDCWEVHVHY